MSKKITTNLSIVPPAFPGAFDLFMPLASFIGWQVLMVVISPFLQMLMTVFGAVVTWWLGAGRNGIG